jgi:hypothetical protein
MMNGQTPFEMADELLDVIEEAFGDPNHEDSQVFEITTMVQGTKTADKHVQAFRIAAHNSGYIGKPLIYEFKRSLNEALRDRLNNLERRPVSIEGWYNEAMRLDRQYQQAKAEKEMFNHYWGTMTKKLEAPKPAVKPFWENNTQMQQQAKNPNTMDVDRAKRPPIKCFKCNRPGHMARDCKSRLDVRNMTYEQIAEYFEQGDKPQDFPKEDK